MKRQELEIVFACELVTCIDGAADFSGPRKKDEHMTIEPTHDERANGRGDLQFELAIVRPVEMLDLDIEAFAFGPDNATTKNAAILSRRRLACNDFLQQAADFPVIVDPVHAEYAAEPIHKP